MLLSELQTKDIINIKTGMNLGRIIDAKVDSTGKVVEFIFEERKLIRKVTKNSDTSFNFESIKKIGNDVILIDM